jgi:hypothetical protein
VPLLLLVRFAAYIGLVVALASVGSRRRAARQSEKPDALLRIPSLLIAALATALVVFPYHLPTERRIVTITPLGPESVMVSGVHNAATPKWMGQNFEGRIESTACSRGGGISLQPLTTVGRRTGNVKQDIDVVLAISPDGVIIEEAGSIAGWIRRIKPAVRRSVCRHRPLRCDALSYSGKYRHGPAVLSGFSGDFLEDWIIASFAET